MSQESFKSRLGFILVSAGCAIGLGNVWKFPYICAANGGAAFIVIYLICLAIIGLPILITEFAVGRGSGHSLVKAYNVLEKPQSSFHKFKYFGLVGNYLLMMFYSMVSGWMINYVVKSANGSLSKINTEQVANVFNNMLSNTGEMVFYTIFAVLIAFGICALGINKGVEKISKIIMLLLFILMIILAINTCLIDNSWEGIKYYLVPDFSKISENGLGNVVFIAMTHAFFTLGVGIGSMAICASYLNKQKKLVGESLTIVILDTLIALIAGLIIIPACVAYNVPLKSGPPLLFISLPNVFNEMVGGKIWMIFFFIFMTFAALSTMIAVYENIVASFKEIWNISRKKAVLINIPLMSFLSLPAVFGFNILSNIQPIGENTNLMDLEDFILSFNLLPLGALITLLFCVSKKGWGWNNFINEVNTGEGLGLSKKLKFYMTYILPAIMVIVYIKGYYDYFQNYSLSVRIFSMLIAVMLLSIIFYIANKNKN
ncbi:MAG: sodium-dependent transporter [Bacteroidales bacterium]|nr:sodium-dependent transporter [Bacteroidales bacterium]